MSIFHISKVSRRGFLAGIGAGGLVLAVGRPVSAQERKYGVDATTGGAVDDPLIFVSIADDGTVTIVSHRSEMGQGIFTSLPMVVADELEADWSRVKVIQSPGDEARYGNQNVDGSRSMRHFFQPMRRCGAAARTMLEQAAAARWSVPVEDVKATKHEVVHVSSGRRLGYGELARSAAALPVPARQGLRLKRAEEFRYIGKGEIGLINSVELTTGRSQYGIDVQLPGMLHAVIARPPVYGGKVATFDASEALKVAGVVKVLPIEAPPLPSAFFPLGGIAVIARTTWAAIKGREKLNIVWEDGPNAVYSSDAYKAALEQRVRAPGKIIRAEGDVEKALAAATRRVEAEYYMPHLAHAPMEPPTATARIVNGAVEVWASSQTPQVARNMVARRLGVPPEKVTVNVPFLGGGFGRKSKPDFAIEAALLSQAMDGTPVKVTWTREDDLRHGFYHTVSLERLEAGLDKAGRPIAWRHRSASPSITSLFGPDPEHQASMEQGMGLVNTPLAIPNLQIETIQARAHTRIGWFRAVANVPHAYAVQSFVAELASAANRDPKDFLLEIIGPARKIDSASMKDSFNYNESSDLYPLDTGRLRRVVERAASEAGWGRKLPAGCGLGIAAHYSFMTYVAVVAEVAVARDGTVTVPRMDVAVDCGPAVNPERIRAQMEGACIFGYALTMLGEISFKNGRVEQGNFDTYQLPRIDAAPGEVRVHLMPPVDYNQPLGGIGEPGVPPIAPALTNAIFAATGKRIRRLPVDTSLLKSV